MRTTALSLTLGVVALAALPATTHSQELDPLKLYPGNYKVLLENARVRVLDFRLAKGATESFHSHPANVAVFLTDVNIRFTLPDGQKRLRVARAGDVSYGDATTHASENIGGANAHGIIVELKGPPAGAPAAGPTPNDQRVTAFTLIHGIPGKEEDLKQHLLSLAAPTRAEPGSIAYDLYQNPGQQHEFLRFEVWSSLAALEAHKQMPHLRASSRSGSGKDGRRRSCSGTASPRAADGSSASIPASIR
jgi:quinol monooxygenase YgiN/quercetin dioxygenase-like cupin family protein